MLISQHLVLFGKYFLLKEGPVRLFLLHDALVDIFEILARKILDALLRDEERLDAGRIGNDVHETLHMVILLLFDVSDGLVVGPGQGLRPEVAPLELQIDIEWDQTAATELIIGEQFGELQEVVVHDFVSDLVVIFYVNPTVLEDSILHLDIVKQAVFWVEAVEEQVFVDDRLSLAWNVAVIFGASTGLCETNYALARFDQVHAGGSIAGPSQELTVLELDGLHAEGHWDQNLLILDIPEHVEALQERYLLIELVLRVVPHFIEGHDPVNRGALGLYTGSVAKVARGRRYRNGRLLLLLSHRGLHNLFGMRGHNPQHPRLLNRPTRRIPPLLVGMVGFGREKVTSGAITTRFRRKLVMIYDSKLAERLPVFDRCNHVQNVLVEVVRALAANPALQDYVHKVRLFTLAKDELFGLNFHIFGVFVDLFANVRVVPFDKSEMAHQLFKDFVVALIRLHHKLIPDHFNMPLCVSHILLDVHAALALASDLLSLDEKLPIIRVLVVRCPIHILKLQLQLFFLKVISGEHIDHLIGGRCIIFESVSQPSNHFVLISQILILHIDMALSTQNLHLVKFGFDRGQLLVPPSYLFLKLAAHLSHFRSQVFHDIVHLGLITDNIQQSLNMRAINFLKLHFGDMEQLFDEFSVEARFNGVFAHLAHFLEVLCGRLDKLHDKVILIDPL